MVFVCLFVLCGAAGTVVPKVREDGAAVAQLLTRDHCSRGARRCRRSASRAPMSARGARILAHTAARLQFLQRSDLQPPPDTATCTRLICRAVLCARGSANPTKSHARPALPCSQRVLSLRHLCPPLNVHLLAPTLPRHLSAASPPNHHPTYPTRWEREQAPARVPTFVYPLPVICPPPVAPCAFAPTAVVLKLRFGVEVRSDRRLCAMHVAFA